MKTIKKVLQGKGLMLSAAFLLMIVAGNVFSMRMTPQAQAATRKRLQALKNAPVQQQNPESPLQKDLRDELIAANWSQEKIKELRQKRDSSTKDRYRPEGQLIYPVKYSPSQTGSPAENVLNTILIDHYAQEIYTALQAIPVNERAAWADELHLILTIGLKDFLAGGKKRFDAGLLKAILWKDDGSEIGLLGTKYEGLKKVKKETNNFATIPFNNNVASITPAEFFKKLMSGSYVAGVQTIKRPIRSRRPSRSTKSSPEEIQKKLEEDFAFSDDLLSVPKKMATTRRFQNSSLIDQAIAQKVKTLEPGEFFVHQQGTADGIIVPWDLLQKSNTEKDLLESWGGEKGKQAITLPFSLEIIKQVFMVRDDITVYDNLMDIIKNQGTIKDDEYKTIYKPWIIRQLPEFITLINKLVEFAELRECMDYLDMQDENYKKIIAKYDECLGDLCTVIDHFTLTLRKREWKEDLPDFNVLNTLNFSSKKILGKCLSKTGKQRTLIVHWGFVTKEKPDILRDLRQGNLEKLLSWFEDEINEIKNERSYFSPTGWSKMLKFKRYG